MVQAFSFRNRPVHLGAYPSERLGRTDRQPDLSRISAAGTIQLDAGDDPFAFSRAIDDYLCVLDAIRDGGHSQERAEIPADPRERANHLKAAAYFLDASIVGICRLSDDHLLAEPIEHPALRTRSYDEGEQKIRLRFNPAAVIKQMKQGGELARRAIGGHSHALVLLTEYPRDPSLDEPGADWVAGMQEGRAAVRGAEVAVSLASYLRVLGYEARAHTATTTDVNLNRLAVSAGLAIGDAEGNVSNPFVGRRFGLAAITTTFELHPDKPLRKQALGDRWRAKGPSWWLGYGSLKNARNRVDFKNRNYRDSRFPVEKLKRVEKTTSLIDEERIPRVPKSSEFFLRAAFGDLGKGPQKASVAGYSVVKSPLSAALRHVLNAYSLLQRGQTAPETAPGYDDPAANAALVKATLHFLGADIAGISLAPDWVWYSHRQDGSELVPEHRYAVSVMIDQGFETMDGASGDDWVASAQSMRTYVRAGLMCGVVARHLRRLGYSSTAHSAADSDVIQTPLVLLAGLGEISRIGETILNPFLGPRLKTGIITTDFPMEVDLPIDFGLQKFCESCNKCARECPSGAISAGPKRMFNGYEIWKPDVEKCTRYRTTNPGGSMCGRCIKVCPWNLEGLVQEAPFRWAAMHFPAAAKWIAKLDDMIGRGGMNPVKKWWWDAGDHDASGRYTPPPQVNARNLNRQIDLKHEDQTLACYPAPMVPPPVPAPCPVDREAGIVAYREMLAPEAYRERLNQGDVEGLVAPRRVYNSQPAFVGVIADRRTGSADGKIAILEIVSKDGSPLPSWEAGAHIDITVTPQSIRQYSLAGDPADRSRYVVGILREDTGRGGSLKIHQMLKPGTPVIVSKPRNHFPIVKEGKRHLLFAGGIGVTPLIAMGHELHAVGADFTLYYKARTRAQAAFIEELEAVAWADRVRFHFSDEDRLAVGDVLGGYRPGDVLYTCGPSPFMDAVFETASNLGWHEEALHREYFAVPDAGAYENHPFVLELKGAGITVEVPAEKAATEALEEAGIVVDVKCRDGLCGVCAAPYLAGEVEHRDYVLSKSEREERMILCCSRAKQPGGTVIVDL